MDELDVPGLYDLAEYTTNNIDEVVRVSISTESVYYKGTKEFRHFMWPCNIGDGKHDVHMVVGGEVAMKDSRLGIR